MTLKTVTVDGISVEVTDPGATVIGTLQQRIADANTKFADAEKARQTALAAMDAELAKKDAGIDVLIKFHGVTSSRADAQSRTSSVRRDRVRNRNCPISCRPGARTNGHTGRSRCEAWRLARLTHNYSASLPWMQASLQARVKPRLIAAASPIDVLIMFSCM